MFARSSHPRQHQPCILLPSAPGLETVESRCRPRPAAAALVLRPVNYIFAATVEMSLVVKCRMSHVECLIHLSNDQMTQLGHGSFDKWIRHYFRLRPIGLALCATWDIRHLTTETRY